MSNKSLTHFTLENSDPETIFTDAQKQCETVIEKSDLFRRGEIKNTMDHDNWNILIDMKENPKFCDYLESQQIGSIVDLNDITNEENILYSIFRYEVYKLKIIDIIPNFENSSVYFETFVLQNKVCKMFRDVLENYNIDCVYHAR